MRVYTKRVYDAVAEGDGLRVLVDRLWPRGIRKTDLAHDLWEKELAPSRELRKRFGHDPAGWEDFRTEYFRELEDQRGRLSGLIEQARSEGALTLLYAARDRERNNAVALKDFLEKLLT